MEKGTNVLLNCSMKNETLFSVVNKKSIFKKISYCLLIYSFVLLVLISGVVAQDMFGVVTATEKAPDGTEVEIKPEINDWGGSDISVSDGQKLGVKYGSDDTSYDSGDYVFSEYGKMVGAEFDAKRGGEYFLGNLRVDIPKGAKVVFKNGEISITDPGKMITKDDVDLVKSDLGWDETELKLSGDGVDYMGLKEVGVDSDGIFLRDPEGVEFDDFKVYGEGKVYLLEDGEPNTEIKGAYLSVNPEAGKFTIGSNRYGGSVSVMPKAENKYGLKHDVGTDYIAFKSISGGEISYLTLQNREAEGLTPKVDAVGYFAVDDDTKSIYGNAGGKIHVNAKGNSITKFGSPGMTMSPIQIDFFEMQEGSVAKSIKNPYSYIFGNDGAAGYGKEPKYLLGGKWKGLNLYHGASNLLSYNYYNGGTDLIEKLFGLNVYGSRTNFLDDPARGKYAMDILFQTPSKYRKYLKNFGLESHVGTRSCPGAIAWGGPDVIKLGVDSGAFDHDTISHELGHVFDMNFGNQVDTLLGGRGNIPVVKGAYSNEGTERHSTFLERRFEPLDTYWKKYYNGDQKTQRAVAAFTIAQGMTFNQGRDILQAIGAGPINSIDDVKRVLG